MIPFFLNIFDKVYIELYNVNEWIINLWIAADAKNRRLFRNIFVVHMDAEMEK